MGGMKMPVTIKDVARISGVSISTVSRVINDSKPVSSGIREKVFKVIEDTGYVPNPVARSLVMKKSQLLGVIVPGSKYPVGDLVNAIEEIARIYQYDTVLCNTYCDSEKEEEFVNLLRSKQAAGIIIVTEKINEEMDKRLKKYGVPTVYYTLGTPKIENINCVDVDRVEAMMTLLEKTQKDDGKIIYLRPDKDKDNLKENCRQAILEEAVKEKKLPASKFKVIYGANDIDPTYKLIEKTLKKDKTIKSIISANDESTLGVIYYLQDNGKSIPDDYKISQIYDTKIAKLIRPGITSISLPMFDIGAICARLIVKEIENKEHKTGYVFKANEVVLPYNLMERGSTK